MTVKELIKELGQYQDDVIVLCEEAHMGTLQTIQDVYSSFILEDVPVKEKYSEDKTIYCILSLGFMGDE